MKTEGGECTPLRLQRALASLLLPSSVLPHAPRGLEYSRLTAVRGASSCSRHCFSISHELLSVQARCFGQSLSPYPETPPLDLAVHARRFVRAVRGGGVPAAYQRTAPRRPLLAAEAAELLIDWPAPTGLRLVPAVLRARPAGGRSWEGMSLHGLGGPSKHNAAEEFWRQRLAKEAKAAEAKATSDSRVSSGFAPAQRSAYVAAEPLIPRAGDYRCARLPPPLAPRRSHAPHPVAETAATSRRRRRAAFSPAAGLCCPARREAARASCSVRQGLQPPGATVT